MRAAGLSPEGELMRNVFDRILRHRRYARRRKSVPRAVERRLHLAGMAVAGLLLFPVGGFAWHYRSCREAVFAAVEDCARTRREYGDELFLDGACVRRRIAGLGGPRRASRWLVYYLSEGSSRARHRWVAVSMLGHCGSEAASFLPRLSAVLFCSRERAAERCAAALALGRIGSPGAIDTLKLAVRNRNPKVREYAVKALARTNAPGVEAALLTATDDPLDWVRLVAVRALGRVGTRRSLALLVELNQCDRNAGVRAAAYEAHLQIERRSAPVR
jgi:hypothetical protein